MSYLTIGLIVIAVIVALGFLFMYMTSEDHKVKVVMVDEEPDVPMNPNLVILDTSIIAEMIYKDCSDNNNKLGKGQINMQVNWTRNTITVVFKKVEGGVVVYKHLINENNFKSWINWINDKPFETDVVVTFTTPNGSLLLHCQYDMGFSEFAKAACPITGDETLNILKQQRKGWFQETFIHPSALTSLQKKTLINAAHGDKKERLKRACAKYGVLYCNAAKNIITLDNNSDTYKALMYDNS